MGLWGGRFSSAMNSDAWQFNASISIDQRLASQDVLGSLAWARQLNSIGVLSNDELMSMQNSLLEIESEFANGEFTFSPNDEDVHSAVERRLYEKIGAIAGKLHSGRSRNDQVSTDFRLWIMQQIPHLKAALVAFQLMLITNAKRDLEIVMPSYTHLQRAQPILLSHWWLSWFWSLKRDMQRLGLTYKMCSISPLGSGAVAGTSLEIDRIALAKELGFLSVSENSMDAISDRDFAIQFLFDLTLICQHLSRLAEQVITFSTAEFGFFALDDSFATGSSLMPQKKNADVFELARGKSGTMIGLLTGLLSTLKGLPSAYDKDLQEDKQAIFRGYDISMVVLGVLNKALATIQVNSAKMANSIDDSMYATDLADMLVKENIPFRESHTLVGKAVKYAIENGKGISELTVDDWAILLPGIHFDWQRLFNPLTSINSRNNIGGTSVQAVKDQIEQAENIVNDYKMNLIITN